MGCCSWCSDLDKKRCWAFLELPKQMNVLDTILIIFLLNSQGATGLFALQLNSCIWLTGQTLPFRNRGVRSDVVTHISNRTKKTSPIGPYKVQRSWSGGVRKAWPSAPMFTRWYMSSWDTNTLQSTCHFFGSSTPLHSRNTINYQVAVSCIFLQVCYFPSRFTAMAAWYTVFCCPAQCVVWLPVHRGRTML